VAQPPSSAANWMYSFEVAHKAYFSAASEFLAALGMAKAQDQSQCEPVGRGFDRGRSKRDLIGDLGLVLIKRGPTRSCIKTGLLAQLFC
jgi:hypothetical protein